MEMPRKVRNTIYDLASASFILEESTSLPPKSLAMDLLRDDDNYRGGFGDGMVHRGSSLFLVALLDLRHQHSSGLRQRDFVAIRLRDYLWR